MKKFFFVILCIIIFVFNFLYFWFRLNLFSDEVWNYGVAYNIANGLVPYRDFNLLAGPLVYYFSAIFILIFGHHFYSYAIFHSCFMLLIFIVLWIRLGKKSMLIYLVLITFSFPNYNIFVMFLFFLMFVIYDDYNLKYRNYIIGSLIGLIFISKISIGVSMLFVMIIFDYNKKKLIGFLFVLLLFLLYLVFNDSFFQFVDYNYLGMFSFVSDNKFLFYLPAYIIFCLTVIIAIFKSRFKDIFLIYVLAFSVVSIPIFDNLHMMYSVVVILFYLFCRYDFYINRYYNYFFVISFSFFFFCVTSPVGNYNLYRDSTSFLYGKAIYYDFYNYDKCVLRLKKYVSNVKDNYDYIFIFSDELTYSVKLDLNIPINKFDVIANGNMGYRGFERYIFEYHEMCKYNSCIFFVDDSISNLTSQSNENILNDVRNSYSKIDTINFNDLNLLDTTFSFSVYDNK